MKFICVNKTYILYILLQIFLNEQFAAQDLMCWMEIEYFRGIPIIEKKMKDNKARQIRKQFFNRQYFFGPQSPANKQQQLQVQANPYSIIPFQYFHSTTPFQLVTYFILYILIYVQCLK